MLNPVDTLFLQLFIAIAAGFIVEWFSRVIRVPDIALFLLVGIALGPQILHVISFPPTGIISSAVLTFGMIVLVYEGGRSLELKIMRKIWVSTTLLATVGVLVTAGVMTVAIFMLLGMPLMQAALAGAVIASTDPAAIIPLLDRIRVPQRLSHLLVAESAFNDATGAVLTLLLAGLVTTGHVAPLQVGLRFALMVLGGLGIGVVVGFVIMALVSHESRLGALFRGTYHPAIASLLVILASYSIAQAIGASGLMAVFAAGIVVGNRSRFGLGLVQVGEDAHDFYLSTNALVLRMLVFVILGSHVALDVVGKILAPGLLVMLVFLFVARPLTVALCLLPDRKARWRPNEILFAAWVRETGVVPAALAGLLESMSIPGASLITAIVFLAVLVTIVGQASTTGLWARVLHLQANPPLATATSQSS